MTRAADEADAAAGQRLDKWLWAARFFKTRTLAAAAVEGGKVHWQGQRTKPARVLRIGDRLDIGNEQGQWTVIVRGLSAQRRPAAEARLLYEETAESQARRARMQEERRLAPMPGADLKGRPAKRAGRKLRAWQESWT